MNMGLNQAMLIIAIVIVIIWIYKKRASTKQIEKYEMDKSQIMQHLNSETQIDSLLVMTAAAKLTEDESEIKKSYKLAEEQKREALIELLLNTSIPLINSEHLNQDLLGELRKVLPTIRNFINTTEGFSSLIKYFSSEGYYSSYTVFDIVVRGILKNKYPLHNKVLLVSAIENMGDLITHISHGLADRQIQVHHDDITFNLLLKFSKYLQRIHRACYGVYKNDSINWHKISEENVKKILKINQSGKKIDNLEDYTISEALSDINFENVVGQDSLTRFDKKKKKRKFSKRI